MFCRSMFESLPLFRYTTRAKYTSLGIALCTMFIVASFLVTNGLRASMDNLSDNFESEMYLVTKVEDQVLQPFSDVAFGPLAQKMAFGAMGRAIAMPAELPVYVFSVYDPYDVLPGMFPAEEADLYVGPDLDLSGNVTLQSAATLTGVVVGEFSSPLFPSDWLLAGREFVGSLLMIDYRFNFAIIANPNASEIASVESGGFTVQSMVGIIGFLESGMRELEADVNWILVPSSFVVAVLAYSFIGSEVADKRHEIGIVKTIGAGRRRVLGYLMGESALLSAWGALLGLALGTVLAYGISTFASVVFTSVFTVKVSELLLAKAFAATVAAGLLGAVIPAVRMTSSSAVQDMKEVTPSS